MMHKQMNRVFTYKTIKKINTNKTHKKISTIYIEHPDTEQAAKSSDSSVLQWPLFK